MGEPDIDAATERVHEAIRALLADEIPDLADFQGFKVVTRKSGLLNNLRGIFKIQKKDQGEAELDPYLQLSWKNFTLYLTNLAQTWWDVFKSFGMMFLWKISFIDFLILLAYTLTISIILTGGVVICIIAKIPFLGWLFTIYARSQGGVSFINIVNPRMFEHLTPVEVKLAKDGLSSTSIPKEKDMSIDIAKLMLLFACLVYERSISPTRECIKSAVRSESHHRGREEIMQTLRGRSRESNNGIIEKCMASWGLEYEPVSELNSTSSAYSAVFWDKRSNWVVISFKGTSPPEFDEWLVDFDYTPTPIGNFIPSFGKVHRGFKHRLIPNDPNIRRAPFDTIVGALKIVTNDLLSRTDKNINVFVTGHSLGSGIANLAYARLSTYLDGLNSRVRIRDGYMFSSPPTCDMTSVRAYQDSLDESKGERLHWRITNRNDVVAVLFPSMGDGPDYQYPDSLFASAHMGTEIKMRRHPTPSLALNDYVSPSLATAFVVSGLDDIPGSEVKPGVIPRGQKMSLWMDWFQYIPLAGWMFSHFPGLYFEALQAVGTGQLNWTKITGKGEIRLQ